ncbi:50S ribosomal protein L21 [bacterium]|nr:50S ribosomal protein L21 [bacterium]
MDYAIVKSGGFQFKVSEGETIRVPRLRSEVGVSVELSEVLAVKHGDDIAVGTPLVENASVSAEIVGHGRGRKILVYKKKRRKGYQITKGHRQDYTELRIRSIG